MSENHIEATKTKTLLHTSIFDVEEYQITLKTGKKVTHTVAKRRPTVVVIPITPDGNVYLIKQYRYLLEMFTLETVAGFIDEGESALQAAKRELKEETGIKAGSWEEITKLEIAASVFKSQVHIFLARELEMGEAEPEEDEEIELVKMSLKEAVQKIFQGEITTSASVSGLLMIEKLLKK